MFGFFFDTIAREFFFLRGGGGEERIVKCVFSQRFGACDKCRTDRWIRTECIILIFFFSREITFHFICKSQSRIMSERFFFFCCNTPAHHHRVERLTHRQIDSSRENVSRENTSWEWGGALQKVKRWPNAAARKFKRVYSIIRRSFIIIRWSSHVSVSST